MENSRRRVVITGVGVVAACGIGADAFWTGLHTPAAPATYRPVIGFDPAVCPMPKPQLRRMERFSHFAVAAAAEALQDAGLAWPLNDSDRAGVCIGTGMGGVMTMESQAIICSQKGIDSVSPFGVPMMMPNAAAAMVSLFSGAGGPSETICTACAAGTHSIAAGMRWIQWGLADMVVAGGADALIVDTISGSFKGLGALSKSGISRPFDVDRDGFCLSEGAGIVILEAEDVARQRNARPYAEIAGAASTSDAYHLTAPAPDHVAAIRCVSMALADAGVTADEVTHFNAHGTSTSANDAAEAELVRAVFGAHQPAVTSVKGATGHSIGAAGAIEAVAVALSYRHSTLPPTQGTVTVDPAAGIDVVVKPRPWTPATAVSTSFAFGGHNGVLVFRP